MKLMTISGLAAIIALVLAVLPAASAAEAITAMGTVTDANGDPVRGANVTLIDDYYHSLGSVMTDANGNFDLYNVEARGSYLVKPYIVYTRDGKNYSTRLENINWYDASRGFLKFSESDTCLYDYPVSDYGYIWGIVTDGKNRSIDCTVYLANSTTTLSKETGGAGGAGYIGSYQFQVSPGRYTIYAVCDGGDYQIVSNKTRITILPSRYITDAAPLTLIADQRRSAEPVKVVPLAIALAAGVLAICIGRAALRRWH